MGKKIILYEIKFKFIVIPMLIVLILDILTPAIIQVNNTNVLDKLDNNVNAASNAHTNIDNISQSQELENADSVDFDVNKLSKSDYAKFNAMLDEEVATSGLTNAKDKIAFKEALKSLFDSKSSNYNNIADAQDQFVEKSSSSENTLMTDLSAKDVHAKGKHGLISDSFAGHAINLALSAATGVGVSAIRKALLKMGKSAAKHFVKRVLVSKLKHWGLKYTGVAISGAVSLIFEVVSPGYPIAKFLDRHDKKKNNGYLEFS
ncbi:Hypothetical protein ADU73_0838 [Pediococcus damnosus]|uniref:hypothetical protein n=1 Tax=Pediococcus damnosus TaxID=51663 RepID=UPI00078ED375|nr:hypothetical protein [Pediococcus damnosus]AMV69244.1 Hypothetical protein ADU73_0838 [Pediococcus damnosus]